MDLTCFTTNSIVLYLCLGGVPRRFVSDKSRSLSWLRFCSERGKARYVIRRNLHLTLHGFDLTCRVIRLWRFMGPSFHCQGYANLHHSPHVQLGPSPLGPILLQRVYMVVCCWWCVAEWCVAGVLLSGGVLLVPFVGLSLVYAGGSVLSDKPLWVSWCNSVPGSLLVP